MLGSQCSDCGKTNTVCLLMNFTERCGRWKRKSCCLVVEEVEMKVVVVVISGAAEENDDERRNEREGKLIC